MFMKRDIYLTLLASFPIAIINDSDTSIFR